MWGEAQPWKRPCSRKGLGVFEKQKGEQHVCSTKQGWGERDGCAERGTSNPYMAKVRSGFDSSGKEESQSILSSQMR